MSSDKLTGIERELVLQYLIDGNIPVTLTPQVEKTSDEGIHSISSQVFPIALKPDHIKVQKNGKIELANPPQSVMNFQGQTVKVEFYFNRVGLYFFSEVKQDKNGLVISVPESINRIKDLVDETDYDFSALFYFDCKNKKELKIKTIPWEKEELFTLVGVRYIEDSGNITIQTEDGGIVYGKSEPKFLTVYDDKSKTIKKKHHTKKTKEKCSFFEKKKFALSSYYSKIVSYSMLSIASSCMMYSSASSSSA